MGLHYLQHLQKNLTTRDEESLLDLSEENVEGTSPDSSKMRLYKHWITI